MPRLCSSLLLSLLVASSASAVTMDWTPVGNPGNTCDPQPSAFGAPPGCFGAVGYAYSIGTHEVTNVQYVEFLNAKAASDPLQLYNINYHIGHHVYPAVPWYNLQKLHAALLPEIARSHAVVDPGYFGVFFKACHRGPESLERNALHVAQRGCASPRIR